MEKQYCTWHVCGKELVGRQRRFCSLACKTNYYVTRRRRDLKRLAIEYKGGKCQQCGYNRCVAALVFHHRYGKDFGIGHGETRSWEKVRDELDKCDLLCSNCHAEAHNSMTVEELMEEARNRRKGSI